MPTATGTATPTRAAAPWAEPRGGPPAEPRPFRDQAFLVVFRSRSRAYQILDLLEGPELKHLSDLGHRAIADAILAHDPVAASAAAAAHVAQTEAWLRRYRPPATDSHAGDHASAPGAERGSPD
jgi:hypothetical protein